MRKLFGILLLIILAVAFGCRADFNLPNRYAVLYGISLYIDTYNEGESPNLSYSDDDAIAMAQLLQDKGFKEVLLRLNDEATRAQLLSDLEYIQSISSPEDIFLFFFSGHGVQTVTPDELIPSNNEWILLHGTITEGGYPDFEQAMQDEDLADKIADIQSDKKIVIIDACNSGGFIDNQLEVDLIPEEYSGYEEKIDAAKIRETVQLYTNFFDSNQGNFDILPWDALVISAAGRDEYGLEADSIEHGILTYYYRAGRLGSWIHNNITKLRQKKRSTYYYDISRE